MSADVHTLIGPWVLDAVDEDERTLVERHLTECAECAAEAAELRETVARLSDVTIAEPPAGLRDRVLHAAHRTRQEAPPAPAPEPARARPQRRRVRMPRWRLALGAAAIAVAAAFAGIVGTVAVLQSTTEQDRVATVLEAADAEVAYQEAEGGGRVTVIASESLDDAVVVVSDLAALSEDRAYQLWLVDAEGQQSAGVMDPGDSSATMLVEGLGDADLIGVTEEPAGGSTSPTLPMIADVALPA
ncbi:anti-sigma factor [Glycomyces sp. NPDC046736]|uniref:anti-sigma factor n=1 Tax=Glycomyces sp. NPDC046736 TaxID=3155615 RepID=UPI00340AFBB8